MKSVSSLFTAIVACIITLAPKSLAAQEIVIYDQATNIALNSGSTFASPLDKTDFGPVSVNQVLPVSVDFIVINQALGSTLRLTDPATVTGPHASDFKIERIYGDTIINYGHGRLRLTFDPSAVGTREATVTVFNNDADEGVFTFAVRGEGVADVTAPTQDVTLEAPLAPVVKGTWKTGLAKFSWKIQVSNSGPLASNGAVIYLVQSSDSYLDSSDTLLSLVEVKPQPAPKTGKVPKKKNVTLKAIVDGSRTGTVFAVAQPHPGGAEYNYENNSLTRNYSPQMK